MSDEREEDRKPDQDEAKKPDDAVLLKDLAPRQDIKGGSAKLRFGERTLADSADQP